MKRVGCLVVILALLSTSLFPISLATEDKNNSQVISSGQYGKGYRYNIQGWVYIHIEGEPYERGYQYGYLASAEIVDTIQRWSNFAQDADFMKIFIIKNLPQNYDKLSEQWWKICRSMSMNIFLKQVPEEYKQEMKGITDGVRARGGKVHGRDIEFEDIVAANFVQECFITIEFSEKRFHPLHGVLSFSHARTLLSMFFKNIQYPGHCSAFIATGDATKDGGIVVAQSSFFNLLIAERCNIILDVQPSKGYRFMMTGPPGSVWSQEDYYQNDQGIVLTETELPPGPFKIRGTTPKGVRSRIAIQYSDSIDDVIESLMDGNNGLIPNEWLIGDTKTGEIASLEQALFNTPIKRTFNGFYGSYNAPQDKKVRREIFGIIDFIPSISKVFYDTRAAGRDKKFIELEKQYYGKIDEEIAKKILSTYPIDIGMTDGKITSSKLMENMGLLAFMGNTNGIQRNTTDEEKKMFHGITELPTSGWVKLYPFNSKATVLQSTEESNYHEGNSRVLWQYETDDISNMNYSSGVVSGDSVYTVTSSGKIYALDTTDGKQIWSGNIDNKSVEPTVSKDLLFVGTDKGLHAINKDTGRTKWEKSIGEISSKPIITNDLVIAGCSDGNIYAFDIESGEKKWTYEFDDTTYISDVQYDKIYIGSGNTCYAFDIANRELIWKYETDGKITAPPRINDDTVYFGSWDGNIYALDSDTGNLKWKYQTGWGIDSKPDVSDGLVFVGSLDNNFYALDENNGDLVWHFTCKSAVHSSPVVYGEYVFFGSDDGRFYALNKTNGDFVWGFAPGYFIKEGDVNNYITTPILSDPFIKDGVVYFSAKSNVYAMDAQTFELNTAKLEEKPPIFGYELFILLICLVLIVVVILLIINKKKKR